MDAITRKHSREASPDSPAKKARLEYWKETVGWQDFHKAWWGEPGKKNMDLPILIEESIYEELGIELLTTNGFMYQRVEYEAFANRIRNAKESKEELAPRGCLLLGQPGIGKSIFLLFFLLQCMSRKEPVLFTNSKASTFFFQEDGVLQLKVPVAEFQRSALPERPAGIWSLVDCSKPVEELPESITTQYKSRLFFVAALSPKVSRYRKLVNNNFVSSWWMSPWNADELYDLLKRIYQGPRFETVGQVRSLMVEHGPCPRDIINGISDPVKAENEIDSAFEKLETADMVQNIAKHIRPSGLSNDISHALVLVRRIGPVKESTFSSDAYFVRIKTPAIEERIMEMFNGMELTQAKRLFRICAGMGSKGAVFAGNLFEGLAIRYTSGTTSESGTFGQFAKMERVHSERQSFPIRFRYKRPGNKLTLFVDEFRGLIFKGSPLHGSSFTQAFDEKPTWKSRKHVIYKNEQDLILNDTTYYCPTALNNPLFDAFFFEVFDGKAILWILQMTIQRDHDGASKGFGMIKSVITKARHVWEIVEVKYVLVVASKPPGVDIEWNFAKEFNEHPGNVFIQQMNLDFLTETQNMKMEDIFGEMVD